MLEKNKKNRDLGAENGSYSSRFVVDLKSLSAQKEEKIEKALIEKIADFNFDKFFAFFRTVFFRFHSFLKLPIIKFQKFYLNYQESKKLKKERKAQIVLKKKLEKASRFAFRQSSSNDSKADFSQKIPEIQAEKTTPDIDSFHDSVVEIEPKKSQSGLFYKISLSLNLIFVSIFQFWHFVAINLFLLFWNPIRKAFPKVKTESSHQASSAFFRNKIFQPLFIAIKSFALELVFIFNKIGNFGPNLYLSLKNKRQNKKFKQEIRARLKQQAKKQSEEFEYVDPPVLSKRKFALASPLAVLRLALILLAIVAPFKLYDYYHSLDLNNLKGRVLGVTEHALADLGSASKSAIDLDFNEAGDYFSQAGAGFLKAQSELEGINRTLFVLASLAPSEEMKMAAYSRQILEAGEAGAGLGENFSHALASFFDPDKKENKSLTDMIDNFNHYAFEASKNAENLAGILRKIDYKVLPEEYRDQFLTLQEKSQELHRGIIDFLAITESLKEFLGATEDKRYLLVFQNNTEMRASGGFIGSFALVDFRRGEIRNLETPGGGSYDTEAGLTEFVSAPDPLHLISPLWNFWDANWWPDWPTSANKLMWFYEKSDGPTVDGVISFTPTVLERFLEIFGEVDMSEEYGVVLNRDNFWLEVQQIVEERPAWHDEKGEALNEDGERLNPKRIIGDTMQKIIQELPEKLTQENFVSLISLIEKSLSEKHILFYFTDEKLQSEIEKRGWDGKMRETNRDYLSVINTNIAGGKSDRSVQEVINHSAEIMPNGAVIATLKITREHTGERGEPFSGVRNVNWMRIYVPEGSELLEAQGFRKPDEIYFKESDSSWQTDLDVYRTEGMAKIHEASDTKIYRENGKTVFANWSMVDPGEKTTIYLKYKLPFILKKEPDNSFWGRLNRVLNSEQAPLHAYMLLIQKQPGSVNSRINSSLKASANFSPSWKYPTDLNLVSDGWKMSSGLDTDKYWALVFKKND